MLPVAVRRRQATELPIERAIERLIRPWWEEDEEGFASYPVDVREENGKLFVDAELPGFKREEIDIQIDQNMLRIIAERKAQEGKGKQHLRERRYTRVERSFTLPCPVDSAKVQAKLEDGVLHLEMQQTEESRPRRIEIK
ncbi:MAG: Hsp20/alpha crystallin family protein [Planctomycetes bacterium]|nr:Hsp20/alpha crystallin family protein [Planctomycetota bacterium]